MNILVTGGTGFVGKQVLKYLTKQNVNISLVLRDKKKIENDKNYKIKKFIYSKNLFEESVNWWFENCKNIDTIIHLAWYAEPGKYLNSPINIECLLGSLNLVKGAEKAGIKRFIGIGTCFEYDLNFKKLDINTPLKPNSVYGDTKASLYLTLRNWLKNSAIQFGWCRLFYLYGENEDERRLMPYIRKQMSMNKKAIITDGDKVRDYLDVKKAGQAISNFALSEQIGAINICSGIPVTLREIAENIQKEYGRKNLLEFGKGIKRTDDPQSVIGVPEKIFHD